MVIVGVLLLVGSLALLFVHNGMLPEDAYERPAVQMETVMDEDQEGEMDSVAPEGSDMSEDTTGGEDNE